MVSKPTESELQYPAHPFCRQYFRRLHNAKKRHILRFSDRVCLSTVTASSTTAGSPRGDFPQLTWSGPEADLQEGART